MKVSVIIATHNPRADYLNRTVAALVGQSLAPSDREIILVDNASSPPVEQVLSGELLPFVRILREPRLGSSHARIAGFRGVRAPVVAIVDDDNILASDYLEQGLAFLEAHPEVGAVGGILVPEFETPPPAWNERHLGLAVRDCGAQELISRWHAREPDRNFPWFAPWGAGMLIRGDCIAKYLALVDGGRGVLVGRAGRRLGGCEDCEVVLWGALHGGWEVAYSPALRLTHCIPARRLRFRYLTRLTFETSRSWGQFCVKEGLWRRTRRAAVPVRLAKAFLRHRAWSRTGLLHWCSDAGNIVGRSDRAA